MNDNRNDGIATIAEVMAEEDSRSARVLVQIVAALLIAVGLLFTGFLNFMLYSRPFPESFKVIGVIPALLIEGSLATFMLGSFVWFAHGTQGRLARIFGWAMFGIVAGNTIVEFNALAGGNIDNQIVDLWAFWGVPVVIPMVVGFWKAVIDADPDIQIMRQHRKISQTLRVGKMNALMHRLGTETSRNALAAYGDRVGSQIEAGLRGEHLAVAAKNGADPNATGQRKP